MGEGLGTEVRMDPLYVRAWANSIYEPKWPIGIVLEVEMKKEISGRISGYVIISHKRGKWIS